MNTPYGEQPTAAAIAQAKKALPDAIRAAVAAKLNLRASTTPTPDAPLAAHSDAAKAINAEVQATQDTGRAPSFPSATLAAAVQAIDIVLPEQLESRVLMIAGMYLNRMPPEEIAERLRLDPELVKREVRKLDSARSVAYKDNHALAQKVVDKEYDVVVSTIKTIKDCQELREMMLEEMRCDYQQGQDDRARMGAGPEEEEEDPFTGKKKRRRPTSIFPMKVDSYSKLIEVEGKQLDRLTNIFGLIKKHLPEDTKANITTVINIGSESLNTFADMFLKGTGNHAARLSTQSDASEVLDVEVTTEDND